MNQSAIRVLWWLVILFVLLCGAFGQVEANSMSIACAICAVICCFSILAVNDGSAKL